MVYQILYAESKTSLEVRRVKNFVTLPCAKKSTQETMTLPCAKKNTRQILTFNYYNSISGGEYLTSEVAFFFKNYLFAV
jgi:hypothetical protein